jgi:hypothetical protein
MTFLLSEDKALRENLQGVIVHDQKADGAETPRQVGVWFGQPDQEIRPQVFPFITIDMIDVMRDTVREMRGTVVYDELGAYLAPDNVVDSEDNSIPFDPETMGFEVEMPIPVMIDYQITTYARHPRHDRELLSQLLYSKLPLRFGQLSLDDNTVRRLEVMDVSKRDVTEQGKRMFVNAITVRVSSEIAQGQYHALTPVQTVESTISITNLGR